MSHFFVAVNIQLLQAWNPGVSGVTLSRSAHHPPSSPSAVRALAPIGTYTTIWRESSAGDCQVFPQTLACCRRCRTCAATKPTSLLGGRIVSNLMVFIDKLRSDLWRSCTSALLRLFPHHGLHHPPYYTQHRETAPANPVGPTLLITDRSCLAASRRTL